MIETIKIPCKSYRLGFYAYEMPGFAIVPGNHERVQGSSADSVSVDEVGIFTRETLEEAVAAMPNTGPPRPILMMAPAIMSDIGPRSS